MTLFGIKLPEKGWNAIKPINQPTILPASKREVIPLANVVRLLAERSET